MNLSLIIAMDINNLIGSHNQLAWYLPADLQRFKNLTMGHYIIMGRKTYESIGRALPGRTSVIITRQPGFYASGCVTATSLDMAREMAYAAQDLEPFVIGGGQIYREALPHVNKIYLTRVYHQFEGDVFFPEFKLIEWQEKERVYFEPDEKNSYAYSFNILIRRTS